MRYRDLKIVRNNAPLPSNFTGKFIDEYGRCRTYLNGALHSFEDHPADDHPMYKCWYKNGKQHRINGPAHTEKNSDTQIYYIDGVFYTKQEHAFYVDLLKLKGLL